MLVWFLGCPFGGPCYAILSPMKRVFANSWWAYLVLFCLYGLLRIANYVKIASPRVFPDSVVYQTLASLSLFDRQFWIGGRPFTVPLFYKLLGGNPIVIGWFQLLFSIFCWSVLAVFVARNLKFPAMQLLACVVLLLFSLSLEITLWDGDILSESLSLSLLVLMVTIGLWLVQGWRCTKAILWIVVSVLWVFTREPNAWLALVLGGLFGLLGLFWRSRRLYLVLAVVLVGLFYFSSLSSNLSQRWVYPFLNILAQRILPNPDRTAIFERQGMPVTPVLLSLAGKWGHSNDQAFYRAPELGGFRNWLYAHGKRSYLLYLASSPFETVVSPLRSLGTLLSPPIRGYAPPDYKPILPGWLGEILYPHSKLLLAFLGLAATGLFVYTVFSHKGSTLGVVSMILVLLVYPHIAIAWYGDALEVERHAIQAGIQLRLGLWSLLLSGLDGGFSTVWPSPVWSSWKHRRPDP